MPDIHDKLAWALEIASRGFYIIPLTADSKVPLPGVSWKGVRTCSGSEITAWFVSNPEMNYGVCPGFGGAIIDVDTGKRGKVGLEVFDTAEGEQDIDYVVRGRTFTVKSPAGGFHLYLLTEEPVTNAAFGQDIETRGEGGYVVGPGCYYDGQDKEGDVAGHYEVILDVPFMQAPKWCLDRMRAKDLKPREEIEVCEPDLPANISRAKTFLEKAQPAIEFMGGNLQTLKVACELRRDLNLNPSIVLDLMANHRYLTPFDLTDGGMEPRSWNERCSPPWEVYGAHDTLEVIVTNADRYGTHVLGEKSGAFILQGLDAETIQEATVAMVAFAEEVDEKRAKLESNLLRGDNIFRTIKPMKWIIPFWLPGAGIAGMVGESGIGKSTLLLDLALRLAHDMEWHETPTRKGMTVVYACGEDHEGAVLQMRAWCRAQGISAPNDDRFIFVPAVPPFAKPEEVLLWAQVLRDRVGKKDVILCLDTWQRATSGLSQNDEREMQSAVDLAEGLGRALGGPVVVAFHSPKSNRSTIAGWEGQRNTSNALWFMDADPRGVKLTAQKVRCGKSGNYILFDFEERDTGMKDETFGFDLKHVVPKRIAGMRITTDGTVYREENLDAVRKAIAEVLWAIDARRMDDINSTARYSVKHAAERIVGCPSHPTLGVPPLAMCADDWAREQMALLEGAGLHFPMTMADMMKQIEDAVGRGGYTFADGRGRVFLITSPGGNKAKIAVSQGDLTI